MGYPVDLRKQLWLRAEAERRRQEEAARQISNPIVRTTTPRMVRIKCKFCSSSGLFPIGVEYQANNQRRILVHVRTHHTAIWKAILASASPIQGKQALEAMR